MPGDTRRWRHRSGRCARTFRQSAPGILSIDRPESAFCLLMLATPHRKRAQGDIARATAAGMRLERCRMTKRLIGCQPIAKVGVPMPHQNVGLVVVWGPEAHVFEG